MNDNLKLIEIEQSRNYQVVTLAYMHKTITSTRWKQRQITIERFPSDEVESEKENKLTTHWTFNDTFEIVPLCMRHSIMAQIEIALEGAKTI